MNWATSRNQERIDWAALPAVSPGELCAGLTEAVDEGQRIVAYFGLAEGEAVRLVAVLADDLRGVLHLATTRVGPGGDFPSATPATPAAHLFEREIAEDFGLRPLGHPWLKAVRFPSREAEGMSGPGLPHPFFAMDGEEVHEVAVGPVHAGVIEPGHFRFQCTGETVHHLEIRLGYQHRGVEDLLVRSAARPWPHRFALAESIAGDSVVAHAWACAAAVEALGGVTPPPAAQAVRGVALELERMGIHLGDLAALCNDVAHLSGNAFFGAMRTRIINSSLALCGSRFGRGLLRPGGVAFGIGAALRDTLRKTVSAVAYEASCMADFIFTSASVMSRLERTGVVLPETARRIGLVGPAGRASGQLVDVRATHPHGIYEQTQLPLAALAEGDVCARARIRAQEIASSAALLDAWLDRAPLDGDLFVDVPAPAPSSLVVSLTEGWRGETVHALVTGPDGTVVRHKVVDPSFHNWFGLALAVRGCGVSDFPLCNKSFNLSYCGFDL